MPNFSNILGSLFGDSSNYDKIKKIELTRKTVAKEIILGLSTIKGVGTKTVEVLLKSINFSTAKFLALNNEEIINVLAKAKIPNYVKIADEISKKKAILLEEGEKYERVLEKKGIKLLVYDELPEKLKKIPNPPLWLFIQGNQEVLLANDKLYVAIVGTRNASVFGKRLTKRLIQILHIYPVVIVSGLAEGIDEVAHKFSLDKKLPNIAFLGSGIEVVFPRKTKNLREEIIRKGGAIVSEYLPKERYSKYKFVQRNRLQAALSDIVIPVEAKEKSGTAHTVKFSLKYGRKVIGIKSGSKIEELLLKHNIEIYNLETKREIRSLDRLIQEMVLGKAPEFSKVSVLLSQISNFLEYRYLSEEDLEQLVISIKRLIDKGKKGEK